MIVVGMGSIGVVVVEELLRQGVPVVVVEADENNRYLGQMRERDVQIVIADATVQDTLTGVQLERAKAVAVLTSDDLANIETGLAVRDLLAERWAVVPVVLRLFDRRLAGTVENSFDFRFVRSPAALAAPWFVGAALGFEVVDTFYIGDQPLLLAGCRSMRAAPSTGARCWSCRPASGSSTGAVERNGRTSSASGHPVRRGRLGVPHRALRGAAVVIA